MSCFFLYHSSHIWSLTVKNVKYEQLIIDQLYFCQHSGIIDSSKLIFFYLQQI